MGNLFCKVWDEFLDALLDVLDDLVLSYCFPLLPYGLDAADLVLDSVTDDILGLLTDLDWDQVIRSKKVFS